MLGMLTVSGLMQVIGIFMLAEVLMPLRQIAILNAFDRNLLPTFLVVSGNISFLLRLGTYFETNSDTGCV